MASKSFVYCGLVAESAYSHLQKAGGSRFGPALPDTTMVSFRLPAVLFAAAVLHAGLALADNAFSWQNLFPRSKPASAPAAAQQPEQNITGQYSQTFSDGSTYEGDYVNGERNGIGTMKWPNGDVYQGAWAADRPFGQGAMTYSDGRKVNGYFYNGCNRAADGVITFVLINREACVYLFELMDRP
jgi:MORN repeat